MKVIPSTVIDTNSVLFRNKKEPDIYTENEYK